MTRNITFDALDRQLAWMNPREGFRRRLLDLFYDTGARWTWHTVLGLAAIVPMRLLCMLLMLAGLVCMLPVLALTYSAVLTWDFSESIARFPERLALARYRKVLRDRDDVVAGNTTHQEDAT